MCSNLMCWLPWLGLHMFLCAITLLFLCRCSNFSFSIYFATIEHLYENGLYAEGSIVVHVQ